MVYSDVAESTIQTYQSIVNNGPLNWLLLASEHDVDSLIQVATGTRGLHELKTKVDDNVHFAFLREQVDSKKCFVFVTYIPESVSGVRRARALVQSRRVGSLFKARQITLTISDLDDLTIELIHQSFTDRLYSFAHSSFVRSSMEKELPSSPEDTQIRRSLSESTPRSSTTSPVGIPMAQSKIPTPSRSNVFSNFMRRKKVPAFDSQQDADGPESRMPPVPPKDKGKAALRIAVGHSHHDNPNFDASHDLLSRIPGHATLDDVPSIPSPSSAEFEHVPEPSHRFSPWKELAEEEVAFAPARSSTPKNSRDGPDTSRSSNKWSRSEQSLVFDPKERARRRIEAQRKKEAEQEVIMREEAARQERLQQKRQRIQQQEMEEDERRRALAADDAKRVAALRAQKANEMREAEERKSRELQARKIAEKERRREESRISEEWRREQAQRAEEATRRTQAMQRLAEEERRNKIWAVETKVKTAKADDLRSGWLTVQTNESLTWRRRFYRFNGPAMLFYRNAEDVSQIVDRIDLKGVKAMKEWNQGYEELEAIPHSFAIEFKDGQGSWSMFADSEDEKVKALGMLYQATGLKP